EIARIATITDDKQLHEAQQSIGIAVTSIVFILNDLFHSPAWTDLERLKLNLHQWQTVDQQDHVVPMVADIRVDTQLVNHFKVVLAPLANVNEGIVQRRTIISCELTLFTYSLSDLEDIRCDDLITEAVELCVGEVDSVQSFELLSEVLFKASFVANVIAVGVFEVL